jgi:tRNA threonylcarbamoyl adenosine modification protein YeaZ
MKNILAVSACLRRCSIAISYEGDLREVNEDAAAASDLVWLADSLVKSNGIDLRKIDGIIAASGPGSFTGLRAAQSFAKGLALSLKLPAASASYFDVLRNMAPTADNVAVVIKSEKGQVYYQTDDEFGISPYESLDDKIKDGATLIGDAADETVLHLKNKNVYAISVVDFRDAKYLLNFSNLITENSQIVPFYISHSDAYKTQ